MVKMLCLYVSVTGPSTWCGPEPSLVINYPLINTLCGEGLIITLINNREQAAKVPIS